LGAKEKAGVLGLVEVICGPSPDGTMYFMGDGHCVPPRPRSGRCGALPKTVLRDTSTGSGA
jgi:hypothetical protein